MGTSHLNVMIRDHQCVPIKTGWMVDLVVQLCSGTPLFDVFPLIEQLKKRYAEPAVVTELTDFPLATDQTGNTVEVTVGTAAMQTLTFTSPAITQADILSQMKGSFTGCKVDMVDGHIVITTEERGPDATLTIGGTSAIEWGPVTQGSGYKVGTRYYHGAQRINIRPPAGETVNHIEMDVPTGCYKLWARVCFGNNEDTSVAMKVIENCGECHTVDLLLPEVMTCSQNIIYPLMDKVLGYANLLPELNDKTNVMKAVAYAANLNREQILVELDERKQDALDIERTDLAAKVDELIAVAQALPQCA